MFPCVWPALTLRASCENKRAETEETPRMFIFIFMKAAVAPSGHANKSKIFSFYSLCVFCLKFIEPDIKKVESPPQDTKSTLLVFPSPLLKELQVRYESFQKCCYLVIPHKLFAFWHCVSLFKKRERTDCLIVLIRKKRALVSIKLF